MSRHYVLVSRSVLLDGFSFNLSGAAVSQRQSVVDGLRTIALKLEFGVSCNQTFEKY